MLQSSAGKSEILNLKYFSYVTCASMQKMRKKTVISVYKVQIILPEMIEEERSDFDKPKDLI